MKCLECLREAPADAAYCPGCGAGLRWACRACEAENAAADKFCTRCRQRVPVPVGARIERGEPHVIPAPSGPVARRQRQHRCARCRGTSVDRDHGAPWLTRALVSLVGRRVYVCRQCACRFYDRPIYPRTYS